MSGAMVDELMTVAKQEAERRAERARRCYDQLVGDMGVRQDAGASAARGWWIRRELGGGYAGVEEQIVALRACRADLITLSRPVPGDEAGSLMTLNAALMQSGRPVLAAPSLQGQKALDRTVRARFSVLERLGGSDARDHRRAALYDLSRTGDCSAGRGRSRVGTRRPRIWRFSSPGMESPTSWAEDPAQGCKTGQSLLAATAAAGADMMVMGAYTRSKLRQLIFGSVTGYIMEHATLPVLLCH